MILRAVICFSFVLWACYGWAGEEGLVAYWKFDEGKGNIAKDSSGKGNDGTIEGAKWVEGRIGKALNFISRLQKKPYRIEVPHMNGKFDYKGNKPILSIGKFEVEFAPKAGWTIKRVFYDANEMLSHTGSFGAVVNGWIDEDGIKHNWTGSNHGGEVVKNLTLIADGKEHVLIANGNEMDLKDGLEIVIARKFSLRKISILGPYIHESILTFEGETIQEIFKFKVKGDDSTVDFIYAFMHCFANSTDRWVAGLEDGIQEGKFEDDNSFALRKDVRWIGIYSEKLKTGVAYIYPEIYKGKGSFKNSFWNRLYDNKLYLKPRISSGKGKQFSFQVTLWFYRAGENDWHEKLERILEKFNIKNFVIAQ